MNGIIKSALVVLAATSGAAFAASDVQAVTGNVGDAISISAPADASITLTPGASATVSPVLTVSATKGFTIKAESDKTNMTQHDGTIYVATSPKTLASTPTISAATNGFGTGTSGTLAPDGVGDGVLIFTGTTSVEAQSVTATITQPVSYNDDVLTTAGHVYRIEITYTATLSA